MISFFPQGSLLIFSRLNHNCASSESVACQSSPFYRFNMKIEGISFHNTLIKLSFWIKLTVSGFMFGPLPYITIIRQNFLLVDNILWILHTGITNVIPCIFFIDLALVLRTREVINPFPGLPK